MKKQYRQGDVLVERVAKMKQAPGNEVPRENGKIILAHGEATGHVHAIDARDAALTRDDIGVTRLEITQALALLKHDEHATIELKRGTYLVLRQREYSPAAIRNVAD